MVRKGKKYQNRWKPPPSRSDTNINSGTVSDERSSNFDNYRRYPHRDPYSSHRNQYNTMRYKYQRFPSERLPRRSDYHNRGRSLTKANSAQAVSPVLGSEEHTMLKIKQTSAIIMRQILNPEENIIAKSIEDKSLEAEREQESNTNKIVKNTKVNKNKSKETTYSVEEIHNKIMSHLTNLNNGKKRNLINSNFTGYDEPIQQIMKQKRLEISRALRNMCSDNDDTQSTDLINSIIPDMGIKIEDLPQEFLEELRCSFDFSVQNGFPMMNDYCFEDGFNYSSNAETYPPTAYDTQFDTEPAYYPSPNFLQNNANIEEFRDYGEGNSNIQVFEKNISFPTGNNATILDVNVQPKNPILHQFSEEIMHSNELPDDQKTKAGDKIVPLIEVLKPSRINNLIMEGDFSTDQVTNERNIEDVDMETSENDILSPLRNDTSIMNQCTFDQSPHEIVSPECNQIQPSEHGIPNLVNNDMEHIKIEESHSTGSNQNIPESEQPSCFTELQVDDNVVEITKEDIYNRNQELFEEKKDIKLLSEEVNIKEDEVIIEKDDSCQPRQYSESSTQTVSGTKMSITSFLKQAFPKPPQDIKRALIQMSLIDSYISDLVKYRKNVLDPFLMSSISRNKRKVKVKNKRKIDGKRVVKKRKKNTMEHELNLPVEENKDGDDVDTNRSEPSLSLIDIEDDFRQISSSDVHVSRLDVSQAPVQNLLVFKEMKENFLDIKVFGDKLIAATESGQIFFFSLQDGTQTNVLKVSDRPISSLLCLQVSDEKTIMCVGTFDGFLKIYNFYSQCLLNTTKLDENAQCMEYNWGYLFIGGSRGSLLRYSVKKRAIEYEDKFYNDCIFVLKATHEGARRVLLIGSRNSPVVIRDAMNGLHLRTMEDLVCPTVYSLIIENSRVYCGTTNLDILVFNFHTGLLEHKLQATNAKGIGCLKSFGRLLFASCHNGNIYVYNIENNTFIGTMKGPGGVILSMEVVVNQVVVGTMWSKFASVPIPEHILKQK